MLTPQEVSTHAFTKAVMGGYNMAMVDEFLDELTDDYTALYKENAALKAKMKVLVEKVEDYRATEDSMRAPLLAAQKMADSIVHEAESKRDQMMTQAEIDARLRIGLLQKELEATQARLEEGKRQLSKFVAASRAVCQQQLELLEKLPELPVELPEEPEEPANAVEEEIEENVMAAFGQEVQQEEEVSSEESAQSSDTDQEMPDYPEGNPFAPEGEDQISLDATRKLNLDDLKFGRNYSRNDD